MHWSRSLLDLVDVVQQASIGRDPLSHVINMIQYGIDSSSSGITVAMAHVAYKEKLVLPFFISVDARSVNARFDIR